MSGTGSLDSSLQGLNDCGCGSGSGRETPVTVENRPGLQSIAYRAGTHDRFKASMLGELPALDGTRHLKTHADSDFGIALIDAWASVLDVLTFYQERIANESYLPTATERFSIVQLARLIGYEPRPGVSATADLAFTLDDTPSAPDNVLIETGTKVQSVPGPNELPQTFETQERIVARRSRNAIKPRQTRRHIITGTENPVLFQGTQTNLRRGDALLLVPDDGSAAVFRQIGRVTPRPADNVTEAALQQSPSTPFVSNASAKFQVAIGPGSVAQGLLGKSYNAADLFSFGELAGFVLQDVFSNLKATEPPPPSVLAFRTRAAVFGHNAPTYASLTDKVQGAFKNHWVDTLETNGNATGPVNLDQYPGEPSGSANVYLDNVYPAITRGSYVVLKNEKNAALSYRVTDVAEVTKADFTLSIKVTRLTLDTAGGLSSFSIRNTTIFAESDALGLARDPIEDPVAGSTIELEGYVDGLLAAQRLVICGELYDNRGVLACESAVILQVTQNILADGNTSIVLGQALQNRYVRSSAVIYGNVARANHGETTKETVGGGDASKTYQTFTLRQPPLTYVSSSSMPGGAASTLKILVNGLQWTEAPALYGQGPHDRVYITRSEDGNTVIEFGDGRSGARLPTGLENIEARYRKGIGVSGNVKAGQLSLLMTQALGVRSVLNPQTAQGGEDPESLEDARGNASLTVLALDRIVSLADYESFARAFAGIAKARATWTWSGQARGVFVTVAGPAGAGIDTAGPTYSNLIAAMQRFGDPHIQLRVASYRKAFFQISARLVLQPDRVSLPEPVIASAQAALRDRFSFDARTFGQAVSLSELISVIQSVPGVLAVEVTAFFRNDQPSGLYAMLPAAAPQAGSDSGTSAAELLTLDPRPCDLGVI